MESATKVIANRYNVLNILGSGSSAVTLLAEDQKTGSKVAIRELKVAAMADWKQLELFQREARVLAGLRHHGIPEIFKSLEETDKEGRQSFFLVQEFIEGQSLAESISGGIRLGEVELIQLTMGLFDIIEYQLR